MRKLMKNLWLYSFIFLILSIIGVVAVSINDPSVNSSLIGGYIGYAYGVGWGLLAIIHLMVLMFTKKESES